MPAPTSKPNPKRQNMKTVTFLLLAVSALPVSAAMIAYYPLDADFNDQSGNGNHATQRGIVTINTASTAVGGGAAAFNNGVNGGGANVLSVNDGAGGLNLTSLPVFTMSIWFNSTVDQTDRRIFAEGSSASTNPLYTLGTGTPAAANGQFNFYRRTSGGAVTNNHETAPGQIFETGTWNNAVWVDQAGLVNLYLNGVFARSYTYSDTDLSVNTTSFGGILRAAPLAGYTGLLDDIGIWNEAPANPAAFAQAIFAGAAANTVAIGIPEPTTGALSLILAGGLLARRRR